MKISVGYKPSFVRAYKKLELSLQEEAKRAIALFQKNPRNPILKTHKLKGRFQRCYSFSVNYKYRIVFEYETKCSAVLLIIGDHNVYR